MKANKINDNYQMVVLHYDTEHRITSITDSNIMFQEVSKIGRGNCGNFNTGRSRIKNNELAIEWYLKNRVIK